MFANILKSFGLEAQFWAALVGSSERQMEEWLAGQRELPSSVAEKLSKAIGVPLSILTGRERIRGGVESVLPPLWLKAKQRGLGEPEHKTIALTRLLAARYDEVLSLTDKAPATYRIHFEAIKQAVDPQSPARLQGERAANAFLAMTLLDKGATGIGEVMRGHLRALGLLVLETPINNKNLEGFCVPVGGKDCVRPCLVSNSYRTTWFRRNYVLLHELAHAIFDLEASNAVFDLDAHVDTSPDFRDIAEDRADSFAMHTLLPRRLLIAFQNRGYDFRNLTPRDLAELIAKTHAEQGLFLRAAAEYGLISEDERTHLSRFDIATILRELSYHARGLAALSANDVVYPEVLRWGSRLTTFPVAGMRLPVPYVKMVLEVLSQKRISRGKAAELLMVTREDLTSYGVVAQVDQSAE
ncbi:MAG: ImmA/IrrE family metallo-endopeptidase [Acidobacteriota bacterium]|jgi:Zn-dependent peptidase ImmA (M78 family)